MTSVYSSIMDSYHLDQIKQFIRVTTRTVVFRVLTSAAVVTAVVDL